VASALRIVLLLEVSASRGSTVPTMYHKDIKCDGISRKHYLVTSFIFRVSNEKLNGTVAVYVWICWIPL